MISLSETPCLLLIYLYIGLSLCTYCITLNVWVAGDDPGMGLGGEQGIILLPRRLTQEIQQIKRVEEFYSLPTHPFCKYTTVEPQACIPEAS